MIRLLPTTHHLPRKRNAGRLALSNGLDRQDFSRRQPPASDRKVIARTRHRALLDPKKIGNPLWVKSEY
jgi:hypothetical protein